MGALTSLNRRTLLARATTTALTVLSAASYAATAGLKWPPGTEGALSLTFDDGLVSQLTTALPLLDHHRLRGTFFVTGDSLRLHSDAWRAAVAAGHELGDHTVNHPCGLQKIYVAAYRRTELNPVEKLLDELAGPSRRRLFAYPCDVTNFGSGSANIQSRRFHRLLARANIDAARTSEGLPNNTYRALRSRIRRSLPT